ncbi:MAG: transcription antitermination factor NusB [bacterium]|nr:transcription antitermination factor NusB [bacterium]
MKQETDPRHEARKVALQALFEWSFNSTNIKTISERDIEEYSRVDREEASINVDKDLALFLVSGITENLDSLDKIIEEAAPEWPIEQIAKIDLEILRIAIFEIYIARSVPPKVAIDEAVELAKAFGGENSSKFVNGVLGTVVKQLLPEIEGTKKTKK